MIFKQRRRADDYHHALVRLAWNLVADQAGCVCETGDECPLCEVIRVLEKHNGDGSVLEELQWLTTVSDKKKERR